MQSRKLRGRPLIDVSRVYSICLSRQRIAEPLAGAREAALGGDADAVDVEQRAVRVEEDGARRADRRGFHGANLCQRRKGGRRADAAA